MRLIHRSVCGALALSVWTGPAAAQEPAWARDLARDIEAQATQRAEEIARAVETLAERHGEAIARIVEAQIGQQRPPDPPRPPGRRNADAARRAAQAAREAERQRRDQARRGPEHTEQISKTLRLGRNGTVDLQNVGGTIIVTGAGGADVRIEATKRVRHPNESQAKALLQEVEVQISERNGNIEIRTDYPRRNWRNWSGGVDYTVSLPREANVVLRSVSGDIRVTSVNGELRAESVSGNVVASAMRRIRQAKSVSGNVEIVDSEGDEVAGGTVSGDVLVRNLKVRTVDLRSVSGGVRMTDVESDRATARSVSGDIDFTGRVSRSGRYEFQSHSGNVRVTPTGTQGFSLEASTFSGDVRSDYPLTLQGNLTTGFAPRRLNRGIRGSFGDGSATLSLQSFSGDIVIVKR